MARKSAPVSLATRLTLAALSAATDFSRRRDGTINRRLLSFLDPKTSANPNPVRGVRTFDVVVDPARDLWFRIFVPVDSEAAAVKIPVVVFFHGGGFAFLSAASRAYDIVCRRFAKRFNAVIVSVDYRRSPEHKWPAPYVDGVDVLRWMDGDEGEKMKEFNGVADLKNVFLMGDSAGANIAHHVSKMYAEESGWKKVKLAGMILIQPYFGGEERTDSELRLVNAPLVSIERTDWLWKAFLPEGAGRDHESCNVLGPRDRAELGESFPKETMVVVGGWDPLQDWQRRYADGLRKKGKKVTLVEYEDSVHAFYVLPGVKEASLLIDEIKKFIERNVNI